MSLRYFDNKVVWITGASSGIGQALAKALARSEATLVISARRMSELERVKNNLSIPAHRVLVLPLDLEKPDEFPSLVEAVLRSYQRIDFVIHCGGVSQRALAKDSPVSLDRKLMEVNFFGTIALTKAVLPALLQQQKGHLVVISSVTGKFGSPMRSAYAASKHALHGFFDSLRAEISKDNIRITLICPGYIRTEISVNALNAQGQKYNRMDENQQKGMPAEKCAAVILKAVERKKNEVFIGGREILAVYIKRFFPGLFIHIIKNMKIKAGALREQ